MPVRVHVGHMPAWIAHERLLGPGFTVEPEEPGWVGATALLERPEAADVQARLRGIGLGGRALEVTVVPPLARKFVRAARTEDARRRRNTSVGFSRSGHRLDKEGQHSLTPEDVALSLGKRAAGRSVLDACCGAGGNAIGFARAGCSVIALELNEARKNLAAHNARLYGVADTIEFHCADATKVLAKHKADLLFVDPPWGSEWDRKEVRLADMPLLQAILAKAKHFPRIWLKLPPSFTVADLPEATPEAVFGTGPGDRQRVKFLLLEQ